MSVTRSYRCDLCHDMLAEQSDTFKVAGKGIQFGSGHICFKPVGDVENHLCCNCISQLRALLTYVEPDAEGR